MKHSPAPAIPSAQIPSGERFYAPQIDGLRFIAALLVIIHHSPQVPGLVAIKQVGWIGVDLFLCISAFLLTRLLRIEYRRTGTIRIRRFFIRRGLRIWPLYLGYATLMSIVGTLIFKFPAAVTGGWLLSHFSFSANLMTALSGFSPVPFTAHLWTISLEEQAYFILPFMLLVFSSRSVPARWLATATLIVLCLLYAGRMGMWLTGARLDAIFVTPFRGDGLVLGAAAALLFEDRAYPKRSALYLGGFAILAAWLLFTPVAKIEQVGLLAYPFLIGACALVVVGTIAGPSFLGARPLAYLGKISFGIYVFHPIAIRVVERVLERFAITSASVTLALIILLTIAIAAVSYRLFETPFLRLKERYAVIGSRPI